MNKKNYYLGFCLSIVFLILFFREINWRMIWHILSHLELIYIFPLMLINFLTILIRAKRWGYLLHSIKRVNLVELYKAVAIGSMANYLLPARAGEFIRALFLGNRSQINKTASLATIVVERVFDGLTVMIMFLFVIIFMPFPSAHSTVTFNQENIKLAGFLSFFFYFIMLGILLLIRFHSEPVNRFLGFALSLLPKEISYNILNIFDSFVLGLSTLKKSRDIMMTCFYSVLLWADITILTYILFRPFQIDVSFIGAIFLNVILVFSITLPSAPGFIGTFHWACAASLIFLGVEDNLAKSYAMILWLIGFLPTTALGLVLLWNEGSSLKSLQEKVLKDKPGKEVP
jgi:glycosyltransferase 2 family protein